MGYDQKAGESKSDSIRWMEILKPRYYIPPLTEQNGTTREDERTPLLIETNAKGKEEKLGGIFSQ